jgi:hypothetical protein
LPWSDAQRRKFPQECHRRKTNLHFAASVEEPAGGETVASVLHFEDAAPDEELAGDGLQTIQSDMPASKALTKMTNKKKEQSPK